MPRRKDNAEPKPKIRSRPSKPKRKPTDKRKPKTTDPPAEEEAVVSRSIMRRHSGRGGRGR